MTSLFARHFPSLSTPATPATGWQAESFLPRATAWRIALIVDVVIVIGVARTAPTLTEPDAIVAWLATLFFAVTFPLVTRHMLTGWPLGSIVAVWGICSAAVQVLPLVGTALLMAIVATIQASRLPTPLGPTLAIWTGLSFEAAASLTGRGFDAGSILSSSSGFVFAYIATTSFRRLRVEKRKTDMLLQEVLRGQDAQIRAATLDERARIAREIHDILAHTLAALAVQLEGTRLLAEQRPGDPAILTTIERARRLAQNGLNETKQAVGALCDDASLPGPEEIPRLAANFELDSGIPCTVTIEGTPVSLSPAARLALYRTTQEALTNIRKHAVATTVAITVCYGMQGIDLIVENQGTTRLSPFPGSGQGLNGMRERAELARGTLEAKATSTGFRVHLWLPT